MFATCLAQSRLVAQEDGRFVIGAPHVFARDKLEQRFRPLVEGALQSAVGQAPAEVQFVVTEGTAEPPDVIASPAPARRNGTPAPTAAAPRKRPARTSAKRRSKKAKPAAGRITAATASRRVQRRVSVCGPPSPLHLPGIHRRQAQSTRARRSTGGRRHTGRGLQSALSVWGCRSGQDPSPTRYRTPRFA